MESTAANQVVTHASMDWLESACTAMPSDVNSWQPGRPCKSGEGLPAEYASWHPVTGSITLAGAMLPHVAVRRFPLKGLLSCSTPLLLSYTACSHNRSAPGFVPHATIRSKANSFHISDQAKRLHSWLTLRDHPPLETLDMPAHFASTCQVKLALFALVKKKVGCCSFSAILSAAWSKIHRGRLKYPGEPI